MQGKQRDQFQREQARLGDLSNEVEAVKAQLSKAAGELAQKAAENEGSRTTLEDQRARLDASRKKYAVLKRKLEGEFAALDSLESKVAELEDLRRVCGVYMCVCMCVECACVCVWGG